MGSSKPNGTFTLESARLAGRRSTRAKARAARRNGKRGGRPKTVHNKFKVINGGLAGAAQDWRTPPDVFEKYNAEFHFTLDAAASHENALCQRYYTAEDNALVLPWAPERVWCNPPYRGVAAWVEKAYTESRRGATVVLLLPVRTDSSWWPTVMKGEVTFLRGRLKFTKPGRPSASAPFTSCVVVFRPPSFPLADTVEVAPTPEYEYQSIYR